MGDYAYTEWWGAPRMVNRLYKFQEYQFKSISVDDPSLRAFAEGMTDLTAIGVILNLKLTATGGIDQGTALWIVVLVCMFVSSFAWSWGPLGWLIPSETFPLETRTAGFSFAVSTNMLCTFVIAQSFLSMMCRMRAGIFFFFSGWIVLMCLFVVFLLPETKNVPIDEMNERVWRQHWYWKRYMDEPQDDMAHKIETGHTS